MKQFITYLCLLLCLSLSQCSHATPSPDDLVRVKKAFLQLRFNAVFLPNLRDREDKELFEMSCRSNRVNCTEVLQLLKKQDPQFYKKLIGNQKTNGG